MGSLFPFTCQKLIRGYTQHIHNLFQRFKGGIVYTTFNLGKTLQVDTNSVRELLLFHFSMFSDNLYILAQKLIIHGISSPFI